MHSWKMPERFRDTAKRDPLNYKRHETDQAKRQRRDPTALKAMFRGCWAVSDPKAGFEAAIKDKGFVLARGNQNAAQSINVRFGKLRRSVGPTHECLQRAGSANYADPNESLESPQCGPGCGPQRMAALSP